jgi:hypothetical protein
VGPTRKRSDRGDNSRTDYSLDALRVGEELEGLQWPLNPHKEDGKQGDNNRQSRPGSAEPQEEVMAGETAQRATKLKKDKTVAIEEVSGRSRGWHC